LQYDFKIEIAGMELEIDHSIHDIIQQLTKTVRLTQVPGSLASALQYKEVMVPVGVSKIRKIRLAFVEARRK